jgi:4-aminobutyrate aminotransferase
MSRAANVWSRTFDITVERGEGSLVWDADGKKWLDFTSGIAVTSVGHSHSEVVAAVCLQASKMMHTQPNCYVNPVLERLCERLYEVTPDNIESFFVTNSGAEAVEAAVKLAKQITGRSEIIVIDGSFHGRTHQAMAMTTSKNIYRRGYGVLPGGVTVAPFFEEGVSSREFEKAFEQLIYSRVAPEDVAGVVYEPVQGEGGYRELSHEYQRYIQRWCNEHGALMIADEIQSGMGRTGRMFAFEHAEVRPDVLVMAKGLASGFPIAAIGTSDAVMQRWIPGSHGGTYGGNPMGCAAAIATIDIIEREAMSNGSAAAVRLREALLSMMSDTNRIERLSGRGLMIGLKMREASDALKLQNALYERGVLVLTAAGGVLRLMPPLVVNEHETEWFIEAMRSSLAES